MNCRKVILFLFIVMACVTGMVAQTQHIVGVVTDAKTGDPIPYAAVHYVGKKVGTATDYNGRYSVVFIEGADLEFSCVGYDKQAVAVRKGDNHIDIQLKLSETVLKAATVKVKRKKYSRKDNPAVELMRKVIAAKKDYDLHQHDFFSYDKYQKLTFSVNEFSEKLYKNEHLKELSFLKDHAEICPETGKQILPLSVQESTLKHIYSKNPKKEKEIITGEREKGVNKLFKTGDILNSVLEECFTDVNINEDNIRLLKQRFISPISTHLAIGFYRYFIADTLMVGNDKCIEVNFTPNNPQDFGFMGSLYVLADSSYRLKKAMLEIPLRSDVNYVEHLNIIQEFNILPTGEQVLAVDKMIVQLKVTEFVTKFQVQRNTFYNNFSLEEIPEKTFKFAGERKTESNASLRDEAFWQQQRPEKLMKSEEDMDKMLKSMSEMNNFKIFLFIGKAFIENFVETSSSPEKPSKVDIGPVNTIFSQNFVDGFRLRMSAQTTANLNRHWFGKGYVAHGFKDHRWKGMGEVTYSFKEKSYMPREYPMHNLIASVQTDVMAPTDKFMPTDKDNVFSSFKVTKVDQMMYFNNLKLTYQKEWEGGFRLEGAFKRERNEPCGALFYQPLDGADAPTQDITKHQRYLNTSEVRLGVRYEPGANYINTKQRRITTNRDAPVFELNHTMGLRGVMAGDYNYNMTEAHIFKRFWVPSAGRIDVHFKAGAQWNSVPYPLLCMPSANLSYIVQSEMFNMINNMEFMNDRYASLMAAWIMNGKIFNRIPLLRHLKLREYLGVNVLWGTLTDKNNPLANPSDNHLFYFPGHFQSDGSYNYSTFLMDSKKPYYEFIVGVRNIFKVGHIQLVRRMNYLDNPNAKKWGIRFMLVMSF